MEAGVLPNLIIIGAMKCATTSLHYYLNLHPQISMSKKKELNFFIEEFTGWPKGVEWYQANFKGEAKIYGESSPNYAKYPIYQGVAKRMQSVVPDAKLIYMVRDPVERMISHYVHEYTRGVEDREIDDALRELHINEYVDVSKYYMQLEQYLKCFPKSHILIVTQEELYSRRQQTLQRIFKFLDVDDSFDSHKFYTSYLRQKTGYKRRKTHTGLLLTQVLGTAQSGMLSHLPLQIRGKIGKLLYFPFSCKVERPTLDQALRNQLIERLRDDTDRLRQFAGTDFKEWSL